MTSKEQAPGYRDNAWLDKGKTFDPLRIESGLDDLEIVRDRQVWHRVRHRGFVIDVFCHFPTGAQRLILCGQDAVKRELVSLPFFYRWSWHADIPDAAFVTFNDPTLYLDDNLDGGWMQGEADGWAMDAVGEVMQRLAALAAIPPERTLLYGISAGGFWALMTAPRFPGSSVVVEIPQTDLVLYNDDGPREKMLAFRFPGQAIEAVKIPFARQLRVIPNWTDREVVLKRLWIYQNIKDHRSTRSQITPFWDGFEGLRAAGRLGEVDFRVEVFNRWGKKGGHVPMAKADTLAVWRRVFDLM